MNLAYIKERLDHERRYLARDGDTVHVLPHLTRIARDSHAWISWSSLPSTDMDKLIADELDHQRKSGRQFEWKLYSHDHPTDLLARLSCQGLTAGETEAVMVYDLAGGLPRCDAVGCSVTRISRVEQLTEFQRVAEEALGKDYSLTCSELAHALSQGSKQHLGYVAYEGTEPVSIGRLYTHPLSAFGGLYGGTTRMSHRRRGFYRAIVAARATDAIELGARYLLVDALPTSRPILEKLGFQHLTDTVPCEWRGA